MPWLSIAGSAATGFFSSTKAKLILVAIILFALLGLACWWVWTDYQNTKAEVVEYKEKLAADQLIMKTMAADSQEKAGQIANQETRHEQDLVDQDLRYRKKIASLQAVNRDVATIKTIERPVNEKDCPVHPAIVASFNILRQRSAASDGH